MQRIEARQESGQLRDRADAVSRGSLPQKRWLDVDEAAAYIGVAVGTLYNWSSKRKQLPVVRHCRKLMFDVHDLDAYMEKNKLYPKGGVGASGAMGASGAEIKVVKGGIFGR